MKHRWGILGCEHAKNYAIGRMKKNIIFNLVVV